MPRRKLARRFEPRFGISQITLDVESNYVAKELEDYLIESTSQLEERLEKVQNAVTIAEPELANRLASFPDRERLALRCMFARDIWHIAKLYITFLDCPTMVAAKVLPANIPVKPASEKVVEKGSSAPILPFKETLFG